MTRQRGFLLLAISIGLVFAEVVQFGTGFAGKTLWDWLGLLIVPVVLAIGGYFIQQSERTKAEKRADVDQQIADDRLKEQALQTYLDHMSELLLKEHLGEREVGDNSRAVARARTLTTLRGLNKERKVVVLQFLYESGLIDRNPNAIDLSGADFAQINLQMANLTGAHLAGVNLSGANLAWAQLGGVNLRSANLKGAEFMGAQLGGTNLMETNLCEASLRWTHLEDANLRGAMLVEADLYKAHLEGASLLGAHLENANLEDTLVDPDQLTLAFLDGAILPDGSRFKKPLSPHSTAAPTAPDDSETQKKSS